MWDTAGQERFRILTQNYLRSVAVVVIVFSVTDRGSFDAVPDWIKKAREDGDSQPQIYVVGNKYDGENLAERSCVTDKEIKRLLTDQGIAEHHYFAVSAKTGDEDFDYPLKKSLYRPKNFSCTKLKTGVFHGNTNRKS